MNRNLSVDDPIVASSKEKTESLSITTNNSHTTSIQKRSTGPIKFHERIFPNIRIQKRIKNRRIQSVNNDCGPAILQKCYSADENIMTPKTPVFYNSNNFHDLDPPINCNEERHGIIYEDNAIIPNVYVRVATLEKLIEELLNHLEIHSNREMFITDENLKFPQIFFLVHTWFTDSKMVASLLIEFADLPDKKSCKSPNSDLGTSNKSFLKASKQFKMETVTLAFCLWIEFYSNDFIGAESCRSILDNFIDILQENEKNELVQGLENCLNATSDWSRALSVRVSVRRHIPCHISLSNLSDQCGSLVFNEIDPINIAEQLTVIEFKSFRRITILDLKNYTLSGTPRDIPRLERSIYLFNGISQWVQCMILSKILPLDRAKVLEKFLLIAKHLLQLHNFNSFYAVIGGITHSTIARLTNTMSLLSNSYKKMLDEFAEVISSTNNFSNYRNRQRSSTGFFIPVLAVHLKDLIFYHTALPNNFNKQSHLINFRKFAQLASTLKMILDQQSTQISIKQNIDLSNTIRLSLDLQYTEEEIYELSLARESKSTVDTVYSNKNALFSEFVRGVRPPNADILKQHIHDMVEAVFKVYDNDKDGLISSEEFDQVSQNFPFIDSFTVLDSDNDGVISKKEMKNYFLRANCNALKNSFKHNFYENTYFKPTFCSHCTGLLWGLAKQGWKCRDCNLNVHKLCRDQVVMECRIRQYKLITSGSQSNESTNMLSVPECDDHITMHQKRRMSQRQRLKKTLETGTQTPEKSPIDDISNLQFIDEDQSEVFGNNTGYDEISVIKERNQELELEVAQLRQLLNEKENQIRLLRNTMKAMQKRFSQFVTNLMSFFNSR